MGDRNVYRNNTAAPHINKGLRAVLGERNFAILTTDLALNRTIGIGLLPKNFVVTGVSVTLSDIDANGTPTHTFTLGDTGSANRYVTTSNIGQAGGTTTTLAATGLNYKIPDDNIELLFTTNAASATAAAGTGTVLLEGFMD